MIVTQRVLSAFVTTFLVFIGANANDLQNKELVQDRAEFNRTVSCVRGNLPMEFQFVLKNNPPELGKDSTIDEDVGAIAKVIDPVVAGLLTDSAQKAWASIQNYQIGSSKFSDELFKNLYTNIYATGTKAFHIEYCGDKRLVDDTLIENISSYFTRAVKSKQNTVDWSMKLPASVRSDKTKIIMLLTALRLAKINVDTNLLISGFEIK